MKTRKRYKVHVDNGELVIDSINAVYKNNQVYEGPVAFIEAQGDGNLYLMSSYMKEDIDNDETISIDFRYLRDNEGYKIILDECELGKKLQEAPYMPLYTLNNSVRINLNQR